MSSIFEVKVNAGPFLKSCVSTGIFAIIVLVMVLVAGGRDIAASPAAIIYDNGGLLSGASSKSGVAAPAGFFWSELSTENGSNFSNTTLGAGCQLIGATTNNRCADEFIVPTGQTWTINSVLVFGYQTGSTALPFIGGNLRIWNGRPGDAGSTIVFGDATTNRMGTPVDTTYYRIGNTLGGAGGVTPSTTGTTRKIWQIPLNVSPGLALTAGTYWVDFQLDGGASGNFSPLTTIPGARNLLSWNARQFIGTTALWQDLIDIGEPTATPQPDVVPNVIMSFPFKLDGTISGSSVAPTSRSLDFDGDNRTDFVVARAATATDTTGWWIRNGAGTSVPTWGQGVGFTTGDKATPADFDGDGKTDVAVWRGGAALTAGFYILQSSNNAFVFQQFGQTGDDPSIVGDFDGDGKADPAIYRPGANGTFYYRGSLSNPGGAVSFVPFGTTGDLAIGGDVNGDGKADFNLIRNNGGLAEHWRLLNGGGAQTIQFGLNTDKFVSGDFDGDGRTDITAVRTNGSNFDWYVLQSASNQLAFATWGNPTTDFLTPGDYDGDNRTDFAVWRSGQVAASTFFYVKGSASATSQSTWGQSAGAGMAPDYPVANFRVK